MRELCLGKQGHSQSLSVNSYEEIRRRVLWRSRPNSLDGHTTIVAESLPITALYTLDHKDPLDDEGGHHIYVRIPAPPPPRGGSFPSLGSAPPSSLGARFICCAV